MAYSFGVSASPGAVGSSADKWDLVLGASAAGSAIIRFDAFASNNRDILSVADTRDGAATRRVVGPISSTGMGLYSKENATAGSRTSTTTYDSTGVSGQVSYAVEVLGLLTPSAFDAASAAVQTVTAAASLTTAAITTTGSTDLILLFGRSESVSRPFGTVSGFTLLASLDSGSFCVWHKRVTSAGSQSATLPVTGGNSNIGAIMIAFQEAALAAVDDDAGYLPKAPTSDIIVSVW